MKAQDPFLDLAPFYDRIMSHVDYDRWQRVTTMLTALLPGTFTHADLACGTGTLLKRLRKTGWGSLGVDFSFSMLHSGMNEKNGGYFPGVTADLRALPFVNTIDYATCLFDSLNFLLELDDLRQAFCEVYRALTPGGLFYFDMVTERMVLEHFDGQEWEENHGRFRTTWNSQYSRTTHIADTTLRVNTGASGLIQERMYPLEEIEQALREAGFLLLDALDARTWKKTGKRTLRIDFVAVKETTRTRLSQFDTVAAEIRDSMR